MKSLPLGTLTFLDPSMEGIHSVERMSILVVPWLNIPREIDSIEDRAVSQPNSAGISLYRDNHATPLFEKLPQR